MKKEEIEELIMLLPKNIRESKDYTFKTKLVLAQLILMNGMERAKNDGYFFVTNQKLVEELGITEMTLIKILRQLETHGFITRKAGKRGEASEYTVNEELIFNQNYSNDMENYSNKKQNYSNKLETIVINYNNKIEELTLIINDLVKSNQELSKKIEILMSNQNYSNNNKNYSTDTESDTDIEKDILNNNNINNINNNKNISRKILKEENNVNNKISSEEMKELKINKNVKEIEVVDTSISSNKEYIIPIEEMSEEERKAVEILGYDKAISHIIKDRELASNKKRKREVIIPSSNVTEDDWFYIQNKDNINLVGIF